MARVRKKTRACIASGYMFERNRGEWDIVAKKAQCGEYVGSRMIDGYRHEAVRVRGKVYAALPQYVKKRLGGAR